MRKEQLILCAVSVCIFGVSGTDAAHWVPIEDVPDGTPLVHSNNPDEDGNSQGSPLCTSKPLEDSYNPDGLNGDCRWIGWMREDGKCQVFGVGDKVWVFGPDEGRLQVLVDDINALPMLDDDGEDAHYKNDAMYDPGDDDGANEDEEGEMGMEEQMRQEEEED